MNEQQNVNTVKQIYVAFVNGDVPAILARLADDVHWYSHVDPVVPSSGDWSGKTDVPGFFAAIGANVDVTSFEPVDFFAEGESVVSTGRFGGTVRATGQPIDSAWVFLFTFADGEVVGYEQFHDGALAAAFR